MRVSHPTTRKITCSAVIRALRSAGSGYNARARLGSARHMPLDGPVLHNRELTRTHSRWSIATYGHGDPRLALGRRRIEHVRSCWASSSCICSPRRRRSFRSRRPARGSEFGGVDGSECRPGACVAVLPSPAHPIGPTRVVRPDTPRASGTSGPGRWRAAADQRGTGAQGGCGGSDPRQRTAADPSLSFPRTDL